MKKSDCIDQYALINTGQICCEKCYDKPMGNNSNITHNIYNIFLQVFPSKNVVGLVDNDHPVTLTKGSLKGK